MQLPPTAQRLVTDQAFVAVAELYCTDHEEISTGVVPLLNISMKSFLKVVPEFPPPPYTWLIFKAEGGGSTVNAMLALLLRPCASLMVTGSGFAPGVVPLAMAIWNENTLLPAEASPCVPSSKNACALEPPIALRSAVTLMPLLAGFEPELTVTVSVVLFPSCKLLGDAAPVPVGGVEDGVTDNEMDALLLRTCASAMVTGMVFDPVEVASGTVALKLKLPPPLSVNA